MGKRQII